MSQDKYHPSSDEDHKRSMVENEEGLEKLEGAVQLQTEQVSALLAAVQKPTHVRRALFVADGQFQSKPRAAVAVCNLQQASQRHRRPPPTEGAARPGRQALQCRKLTPAARPWLGRQAPRHCSAEILPQQRGPGWVGKPLA
jgi:hypothetical protein